MKTACLRKPLLLCSIALTCFIVIMSFGNPAWAENNTQSNNNAGSSVVTLSSEAIDISWYEEGEATYYISNAAQLRGLSALVNGTATDASGQTISPVSFKGCIIYQQGNIDLASKDSDPENPTATEFTPIGNQNNPFEGQYIALTSPTGKKYTITNLSIKNQTSNVGLFGYCTENSTISGVTLDAGTVGGITVETATEYVRNVGSVAGFTAGTLTNCSSNTTVTVNSTGEKLSTNDNKYVVRFVGGLAGYSKGIDKTTSTGTTNYAVQNCAYEGAVTVTAATDAPESDSTESERLHIADSVGGLIGRFGDPDCYGTIYGCSNNATVTTDSTGSGDNDRFGTRSYACIFFVGGICGYTNGNIINCSNGSYNPLTKETTGNVITTATEADGSLANNRGADQTGGICGGIRSVSDVPGKYNDGDPSLDIRIENCHNEGQISGLVAVAGIVGETGVAVTVTKCYNGTVSDPSDWNANQSAGKVTSTRWNKPLSGGICGQTRSGFISYCANYAEVRNTQTGYYMAGIAGSIFASDDYPEVTGEIYSCLNTGGIYTSNTSKDIEYREAGICGDNEGNVHDCIMLEGSVPYHSDSAIGGNDWGVYSNLYVKTVTELQNGESAALLNILNRQNQDWNDYWFINKAGYPVLTTWANLSNDERVQLSKDNIASVAQISPAPYGGEGSASVPTLKVTLNDGTVLVQNCDFYVIPQSGATEMTDGTPYVASIEGIGLYKGRVENCANYGIGKGSLDNASVTPTDGKYNFGKVVFPESVQAIVDGSAVSASEYDIVIYASEVSKNTVEAGLSGSIMAYDSEGYISFDKQGTTKIPVSNYTFTQLNELTDDWWLWNKDKEMISDSKGNVYYATGNGGVVGNKYEGKDSLIRTVPGTPSGYLVKVKAKDGSNVLEGKAYGYYAVKTIDLYRECSLEKIEWNGSEWYWDNDKNQFYTKDASGNRSYCEPDGRPEITFTGETITPTPTVKYNDHTLAIGQDVNVISGDPDADSSSEQDQTVAYINRNVTDYTSEDVTRAAITIRPTNTNFFNNYTISYFKIKPAKFTDCQISLEQDNWAYTGEAIEPDVKVTLNGVELVKDVDYKIAFNNNIEKGEATYTVTPLTNLSDGDQTPYTGKFTISDGTDISSYTLGEIADQQFNYGYDVSPELKFYNAQRQEVTLTEGVDYTTSYSTTNVTKCVGTGPDGTKYDKQSDPCTVTIKGTGLCTGELTGAFNIVPYDAKANATKQLTVQTQSMCYGTWGNLSSAPYNVGISCPVVQVTAKPIIDWTAYRYGDTDKCYGNPIALTSSTNATYGGLTNTYPAEYYDEQGTLVSYDGAEYKPSGLDKKTPAKAQPGKIYAKINLRVGAGAMSDGTTSIGNGALGTLEVADAIEYKTGADLSQFSTWSIDGDTEYTGRAITPVTGKTKGGNFPLTEGEDYTIEYSNNTNPGEATFTVTAKEGGYYTGTYSGKFTISKADISDTEKTTIDSIENQTYTGAEITPSVTISVSGKELTENTDYTLTYTNNVNVGTATITIRGVGDFYTGITSTTFEIVDKEEPKPENPFIDVDDSTPHSDDIIWLANAGISTGWDMGDGTKEFRPMLDVARCDMAAFLYRLAGNPAYDAPDVSPFADVDASTPHYKEVCWLASIGVSKGWAESDGTYTFRPLNTVARQDMAAFLHRLSVWAGKAGSPFEVNPFSDVVTGDEGNHASDVIWLAATGVSEGWTEADGTKTFRGTSDVVRCDMAAFLHRMAAKGLI